ncbi:hypothetical protein DIPPA_02928 [Diplonema papillatum]|nr:hypothetical protein DIPPA_02928 [Diplonema papillatum]
MSHVRRYSHGRVIRGVIAGRLLEMYRLGVGPEKAPGFYECPAVVLQGAPDAPRAAPPRPHGSARHAGDSVKD